jgi:hypothetical protein
MTLIKGLHINSKTSMRAGIILITLFLCLGIVSCTINSTVPQTGDTPVSGTPSDNQKESSDVPQTPPEDAPGDRMAGIAGDLESMFYELDPLLLSPEIENDDWISLVMALIADITSLCDEARQISPAAMTDDQVVFLEAVDGFDTALDILVEGINNDNTDTISQASAEMWLAIEIIARFTE